MTAQSLFTSEYREFTYRQWQPDEVWCSLAGADKGAEQQAQQFVWEKARPRIEAALLQCRREGWELAEPIGPQAIVFSKYTERAFKFEIADVLLWILTLGVALLMQLALNFSRQYVIYKPVELCVPLMRCKENLFTTANVPLKSEALRT